MAAPTWTETLIAAFNSSGLTVSLSRNATLVDEVDARSKFAVKFLIRCGRTSTAALTNGVDFIIRPKTGGTGAGVKVAGTSFAVRSSFAAAVTTTISGANVAAGDTTLNVVSTTGWAVGDIGILAAGTTSREEWFRVARVTDSTHLLIDSPCQYAHTTAQADALFNKSDVWVVELDGGCKYEIVADYGDDAAGAAVRVWASALTLDTIA